MKKGQTKEEGYDAGNPEMAKLVTEAAQRAAAKLGKERPDDSEEFYDEFLKTPLRPPDKKGK